MASQWQGPPEAHPLDSARGKLVRAKQHAHYLCAHCDAYTQANPVRLDTRTERGDHLVFAAGTKPPLYLALILGEVVHDLRSALDHVAWQLATDHAGPDVISRPAVARAIQFPIAATKTDFDRITAIRYFSPAAVERIEAFQPYHNEAGTQNPLSLVQSLSNVDKHRVLMPFVAQLRVADLRISFMDLTTRQPWKPDWDQVNVESLASDATLVDESMPILRIRTPAHVAIRLAAPVRVCFSADLRGDLTVFFADTLPDLCMHVVEVLEPLAALFPTLDWTSRTASWTTPDLPLP